MTGAGGVDAEALGGVGGGLGCEEAPRHAKGASMTRIVAGIGVLVMTSLPKYPGATVPEDDNYDVE